MGEPSSKKALNDLFVSMGRSASKDDYNKYTLVANDLNKVEDLTKLAQIVKRYVEFEDIEMSEYDAKEVKRIYAKL